MPATVGILTLELHIESAQSLKDKRQVVKGLKDRLRSRFNVSVAEIDGMDTWQRAVVAVAAVAADRPYCEQLLQSVEEESANMLGAALMRANVEFW